MYIYQNITLHQKKKNLIFFKKIVYYFVWMSKTIAFPILKMYIKIDFGLKPWSKGATGLF